MTHQKAVVLRVEPTAALTASGFMYVVKTSIGEQLGIPKSTKEKAWSEAYNFVIER